MGVQDGPEYADSESPLWAKVLAASLPDEAVRSFLQRLAGYTLAGTPTEDVLVLLHGITRSGKGTIQSAIAAALGDYAQTAELDLLAERARPGGPRPEVVRLRGARMLSIYETSRRLRLSASLVKTLTGSDPIVARGLYQPPIEFQPQCVMWIATNYRPHAPADDAALWERLREVPFLHHIAEQERDPKVREELSDPTRSGAAILAWMLQGHHQYRQQGLGYPEAVRGAVAAYRATEDPATHIRRYLTEGWELSAEGWTPTTELRESYRAWAIDHDAPRELGDAQWTQALRSLGCTPDRRYIGRGWKGLRPRADVETEPSS